MGSRGRQAWRLGIAANKEAATMNTCEGWDLSWRGMSRDRGGEGSLIRSFICSLIHSSNILRASSMPGSKRMGVVRAEVQADIRKGGGRVCQTGWIHGMDALRPCNSSSGTLPSADSPTGGPRSVDKPVYHGAAYNNQRGNN